jgi:streptogramin lyase
MQSPRRSVPAWVALAFVFGLSPAKAQIFPPQFVQVGSGFSAPHGVAVDSSGNIFVADTGNNAIKMISVAGGSPISIGTSATPAFSAPSGVAVDGAGNVYVADTGNHMVRKIQASGGFATVSTLCTGGNTIMTPVGVAVDSLGNVFVADQGQGAVEECPGGVTATSITATFPSITFPAAVAVDRGNNVFVADDGSHAAFEIFAATSYTTMRALGTGGGAFFFPTGVALDGGGNVFVTDDGSSGAHGGFGSTTEAVYEYTFPNYAGSEVGLQIAEGFDTPSGVAVTPAGNLLIADSANSVIDEIILVHPPVPTLGTWALGLCALLLGGVGYQAARRRVS